MTRNILELGPRLGELARRAGINRETLRYRFQKYFVKRGFMVQANLDYQKLGLGRLIIVARLAAVFEQHAYAIMSALSEMSYLTGFAQTTLEGLYIMQVVVPVELREECAMLYDRLHQMGVFSELQVLRFEEVRSAPMKAEYYDFANGLWEYDWQGEEIRSGTLVRSGKAELEKYDYYDLLLLKELNRNASQPMVEIAKKLNVPYKMLQYHYRVHVSGRGLLRGYKVLWQGTNYNLKTEKAGSRRHTFLAIALLAVGTTDGQRAKLVANLNQIPFLWFEASNPNYYAEFFVPTNSFSDLLKRIRELAVATGTRPQLFILDQSRALRFSIGYKLFDAAARKWGLESGEVISRFENLVVSVNNSGGWT